MGPPGIIPGYQPGTGKEKNDEVPIRKKVNRLIPSPVTLSPALVILNPAPPVILSGAKISVFGSG
jgi:hypothetical protein